MKPIAILQHEATQGPGVLGEYLMQQGIPFEVIAPCLDQRTPVRAADYRGVVVLGSNHCANEQLRWIEQERCLLQDALAHDVPVLGHCFGAQMLARAMGAKVWRNPCPNIGWSRVWVTRPAQDLLHVPRELTIFNWHYDTFAIPRGAMRSMYGAFCLNKGFVQGRNWAFQGHLEVTAHSVKAWCGAGRDELRQVHGPAVQHEAQILAQLPQHIEALHATAMHVYSAWTRQLDRPLCLQLGELPDAWPAAAKTNARLQAQAAAGLQRDPGLAMQYQAPLAEKTKAILAQAAR
ncbi:type 1 glutamine amidotransferase [Acidovorax cavernicola]|uniref:Type 1 glutamine amidotransferase n=1 Tax=Acidovorax cavernicola TaxID=1675792 RepID=A0A9X8CY81_9BURK|nr:type 1 glutamine amidotransferase [Acidovorax cavernicola]